MRPTVKRRTALGVQAAVNSPQDPLFYEFYRMDLFDLTLATPAENLALDEALLNEAEASPLPLESLRLWESPEPLVVVGRNSNFENEVKLAECRTRGVPVLRRSSGGCAIVAGPGCLMYAVVLSYDVRPALRSIEQAHQFVLGTLQSAIRPLLGPASAELQRRGTSDLTLGSLKFSGNSLRCRRRNLLYHGTLLYDFPLELVAECLTMPPREPDYRANRDHQAFIANLSVSGTALRKSLIEAWQATPAERDWPRDRVHELAAAHEASAARDD